MTDKFTRYLGQKFRGGYRPRTQSNSSQSLFTSSRRITFIFSFAGYPRIFSYPRTRYWAWPFLTRVAHMRPDIGPGLPQCSLNTGYQLAPTIAPQNLAFRLLGRKGGFWFSRLIYLMIWFYWFKSQLHVFVSLWPIPDLLVPRACLHLILATPLSPTFNGWTIIQRRLNFLGIWAGEFPLLIFAPLWVAFQIGFLSLLNDCVILEPNTFFLSFIPLRVYKYQNPVRGPFLTPISLPKLSPTLIPFIVKFPL